MNIEKVEKPDLVLEAYQMWRNNPVTTLLVNNLKKMKENFVDHLSARAVSLTMDDAQYRRIGCELRQIDAILNMVTEYKVFTKTIDTTKTKLTE